MKAMLLTAGVGTRMFPLALTQPKPSIPVLGRPLVVQILHWLGLKGVDEAVLNLHHLPDGIKRILGDGVNPGLPVVHYSHEEQILGTAGGIRNVASSLKGDGPIVVCNADFLSDIDLEATLELHRASGFLATLVLVPRRPGYSVVLRDAGGRVLSLGGEPQVDAAPADGEWLFTGCQIIEEELIDRIPSEGPRCMVRDVYRPLAGEGRVGSVVHDGFWWEFGSPELYLDGCLRLLAQPADCLKTISSEHDPLRQLGDAVAAVGPGAGFDMGAQFVGRVALGYSSYVSEDTYVENSVVMPEAWIGPGCRVERSVIGQGVELPAGFHAVDQLICLDPGPSLELPPSTRRRDGLLLYSFVRAVAR
jgi:NDP-sugar pyrophosphorylase family protein